MSIHVISKIMKKKFGSTVRKLIAIKLADCANDDGTNVYPSIERLASEAEVNRRTVQRTLRAFEEEGILVVREHGGRGPTDTTEYDFNMDRIAALEDAYVKGGTESPFTAKGGTDDALRAALTTNKGGTRPPEPSLYPSIEPSHTCSLPLDEPKPKQDPGGFDEFYRLYPRKVAKRAARKAYAAALKRADHRTIMAGVERYAAQVADADPRYIAHAATWLNADRWLDEDRRPAKDEDMKALEAL